METLRQKTKSARPRAKMYLRARLGWLWGYPLSVKNQSIEWQQLYYPMPWDTASQTITQKQIAAASVSHNKLLRDFPYVLPGLVGNKADWSTQLTLKLQTLRALTEGETPDPMTALLSIEVKNGSRLQQKANGLRELYPELQTIITGFVWWLSLDNKVLMQGLEWIEQNNTALHTITGLETDAVRHTAIMFTLAQQTSRRSATHLINLVAHPAWQDDNLRAKQRWLDELSQLWRHGYNDSDTKKLLSFATKSASPNSTEAPILSYSFWFTWSESLLLKHRKERNQQLAILQLLLPPELLDSWLELKTAFHQQIALITQILHDTQQQLNIIDQQFKLIREQDKKFKKMLQAHPGRGEMERKYPKRKLAEQRRQHYEQKEALEQERQQLLEDLKAQLEPFCTSTPVTSYPAATPDTIEQTKLPHIKARQKLSYLPDEQYFDTLLEFSLQNRNRLQRFQTLIRTLQVQHDWHGADSLLRMVSHWQHLHHSSRHTETTRIPLMMDSVLAYLRQADKPDLLNRRLLPWNKLLIRAQQNTSDAYEIFDFAIGVYDEGFNERDEFLALLGELCESRIVLSNTAKAFLEFWIHTPQHWPHITYFTALNDHDIQLIDTLKQQDFVDIDALLDNDYRPEHFLALIKTWQLVQIREKEDEDDAFDKATDNNPNNSGHHFSALTAAARLISNGYGKVAGYFQKQQQWQMLAALKPSIEQYEKLTKTTSAPPPVIEPDRDQPASDWQQHYPAALHPALNLLQHYHPQAEKVASTILSGHFPQAKAIAQEITALEQRIPLTVDKSQQLAMQKRRDNLQQRLEHPVSVSARQLEKLQQKLRHAAYTRLLDNWQTHCHEAFRHHLAKHFDLPQLPEQWLQDKRKIRSLVALTELDDAEQKVAGLLLRAHYSGTDPDLRNEPANRDWLESMQRAGINMHAWLNNEAFETTVKTEYGQAATLTLRFADNVFDVLQMGDHFNTCLSHNDFNFFSVVANAADLNKRVVYAYDTDGRIQGRCLLGISREKNLLTFYPYSHLHDETFTLTLSAFINWLEQEMGIQRSAEGEVPVLLARNWYDDGAQTIMPEYAALKPNSHFRQQLDNLAPQDILNAFQQAIAPHTVNGYALSQLLRLECFHDKPQYLFALHQQIQQTAVATNRTNSAIVEVLLKQKTIPHEQVWPLAKDWIYNFIIMSIKHDDNYSPALMDLLLSRKPLLILRLTRMVLSESDASDHFFSGDLHVYQARAYLAIHRPRKAAAAYQAAITMNEYRYYRLQYFTPEQVQHEINSCHALPSTQQS